MVSISKTKWFLLFIFLNTYSAFSQRQTTIDSILQIINSDITDKEKVNFYVEIANEYNRSDSLNATKYTQLAIELADKINYKEGSMNAYYERGWMNLQMGYYEKAELIFTQLIEDAKSINYQKGYSQGLNGLGILNDYQGNYEEALGYYLQSIELKKYIDDKNGLISSYKNIGHIYSKLGDYSKSEEYYMLSLKSAQELGNNRGVGLAYLSLGITFSKQGNYEKSLNYYFQSLEITEELGDKRGMSFAYNNIGQIYENQGQYKEALNYYFKSLELKKETGDKRRISTSYNNIGAIYTLQGEYEKALNYHFQALEIRKELGNKDKMCSSFKSIGSVYLQQGDYKKALEFYLQSLELAETINSNNRKSTALIGVGRVYASQKQWKLAQKNLKKALNLAHRIGLVENIKITTEQLALVEKELGNYKAAYNNYVLFKQMEDSLENQELIRNTARIEAEYEFRQAKDSIQFVNQTQRLVLENDIKNRKNLQVTTFIVIGLLVILIIILWRFFQIKSYSNQLLSEKTKALEVANKEISTQKHEITAQNEQLQELNAAKNRVFSIVAHDLRSPINSLQSLLMLFKADYNLTQQEMSRYIGRLSENVAGIAGLLKNLLFWSKNQMEGNLAISPKSISPQSYVEEAVMLLRELALTKTIQTEIEIEDNLPNLVVDPEILRFLLRNLLNNAYKFSHNNGQVTIKIHAHSGHTIKILIQDNGIGINDTIKNQLFKSFVESQQGTQSEQGTGLGLMLCKEFVEKSGGMIGVESELDIGSKFWFTLPQGSN